MKKHLLLALLTASSLLLAGCSLGPPNKETQQLPNPNNSIWVSDDSGRIWKNNFPSGTKVDISSLDVISMAVNPYDAKNVYVGLLEPGILKTDDGGLSWEYLNFESQKVYGLDIDPGDGRIIYASGVWHDRGKIFKSTDSGENWKEIYTSAANGPLVIALAIDKKNSSVIYAATNDNQIIKTTDAGTSWQNVFMSNSPVIKIAIDKFDGSLVYGVTKNEEIFRSDDGGKEFENITRNLASAANTMSGLNLIETDPSNKGWVYAGGGAGLFVSHDSGDKWEKIEILNNPQSFPVKALAVNPKNSKEMIYGAAQAAYRSVDGGSNWATFQFNLEKNINIIKYSTADPTRLYLGFSK